MLVLVLTDRGVVRVVDGVEVVAVVLFRRWLLRCCCVVAVVVLVLTVSSLCVDVAFGCCCVCRG